MSRLLALTRGDPSGIGLEVAFKAWLARDAATPPFVLVADPAHCRAAAAMLRLDVPVAEAGAAEAAALFPRALPVLPLDHGTRGVPGLPDPADAPGTIASMERAVALVRHGEAAAVVTLPVSKEVLHKVGYPHPGQTEFMGELARRSWGATTRPVMLLWSPVLAVVPATVHVPLASVPGLVTAALIADTVRTVARDMTRRFGLPRPRIAVAGLNPHGRRGRRHRPRGDRGHRPRAAAAARRGFRRHRPAPGRHAVPRRRPRPLRRLHHHDP